ncbi:MAG: type I-E CRISPR-associated protein Cas6/Cse3/CasE [Deltaproteobacteria bacterium]|nr:type I-E CRISPR-associated protein Cas6/Cse3/CasE [Deltaproteobacteria bacterium]
MYLSQLILEHPPRSRALRRDLAFPYQMHKTLSRAFADQGQRVLFRLDSPRRGAPRVLVQSEQEPDWSFLGHMPGYASRVTAKPFVPDFSPGQLLRFRLRANPTKKVGTSSKAQRLAGKKNNGQRLALLMEEDQRDWLARKAAAGGFVVNPAAVWISREDSPRYMVKGWQGANGNKRKLSLFSVLFEGYLQVRDPGEFVSTLRSGIGPGKGLGFGLLSLAPA